MKIIIEVDGRSEQQPEVRRVSAPVAEQQYSANTDSTVGVAASPIDAGQPRISEGFNTDASGLTTAQQFQGAASSTTGGAVDAGAARIADQTLPASAMPDTGDMQTFNTTNAFSAGSLVSSTNN